MCLSGGMEHFGNSLLNLAGYGKVLPQWLLVFSVSRLVICWAIEMLNCCMVEWGTMIFELHISRRKRPSFENQALGIDWTGYIIFAVTNSNTRPLAQVVDCGILKLLLSFATWQQVLAGLRIFHWKPCHHALRSCIVDVGMASSYISRERTRIGEELERKSNMKNISLESSSIWVNWQDERYETEAKARWRRRTTPATSNFGIDYALYLIRFHLNWFFYFAGVNKPLAREVALTG
jgi:hypothetical protein